VQFVERNAGAAQALRENLARLKVEARVSTLAADAYLRGPAQVFDLVFLDPPFESALWAELARRLEAGGWLAANALIYVESPRGGVPGLPANWVTHREARAGEVRFALYRRGLPLS
jgi:16S rRNA (guanine966-N2)-methyltransferase